MHRLNHFSLSHKGRSGSRYNSDLNNKSRMTIKERDIRDDKTRLKEYTRRRVLFEDSEGESDIEQICKTESKRKTMEVNRRSKIIKTLKVWDVKFTGEDHDDLEEFLARMEDCMNCAMFNDQEVIQAVPSILKGNSIPWFRTIRGEAKTWKSFKRAFRREYLMVIDELRSRAQAKGEKISAYLTCL